MTEIAVFKYNNMVAFSFAIPDHEDTHWILIGIHSVQDFAVFFAENSLLCCFPANKQKMCEWLKCDLHLKKKAKRNCFIADQQLWHKNVLVETYLNLVIFANAFKL